MSTALNNNSTRSRVLGTVAISDDEMRRFAPSVFASQPIEGVSERYSFLTTSSILNGMRENGWVPVRAQEQSIRTEARRGFQKHVVRFARVEHLQTWEKNQVRPEVVLVNSHDKSSAYQLHCGLFRLVCTNGMVVSDGTFQRISIKHSGFNPESVIEASVDVTNALHVAPEELGGLLSSEVVSEAFVGARLVKVQSSACGTAWNESALRGAAAGRVRIEQ